MAMRKQSSSLTKHSPCDVKGQSSKLQKVVQPDERNLTFEELFSLPKAILRSPVPLRDKKDFRKKTKSQLFKEKETQVSSIDCVTLCISSEEAR
jgi:hypothetical protein